MLGYVRRFLPLRDLRGYRVANLRADMSAGFAVTLLSVPQGIAYALVAGLPPVMGLYAAAVPAIVGSLFRSSRHVITGPTNALALLVASVLASQSGADPVTIAITLAALTGLLQFSAGFLSLGALVDYISAPVALGYISGAGVLIIAGQLPNATGSPKGTGTLFGKLAGWLEGLPQLDLWTVVGAVSTVVLILGLKRLSPRIPAAALAVLAGIVANRLLDLDSHGIQTLGDLAPIVRGFPPLTTPDFAMMPELVPAAVAAMVLSFVESSSVARSLAMRTRQRVDMSAEFAGQGLANVAAGLTGAFATSGSLARSALNHQLGAKSRLGGAFSGIGTLAVLALFGPLVNDTPIACLAGVLLVIASDLVDLRRIRTTLRSTYSDAIAFLATLIGTWLLPLDRAILFGVAISIILFLRSARLLVVAELVVEENGTLREVAMHEPNPWRATTVRILNLEGRLFFGAAGELQAAFDSVLADDQVHVLVVRLKRTQSIDVSAAAVFAAVARRLQEDGRHLILAGLRPHHAELFERTGVTELVGEDHVFPTEHTWFAAMNAAIRSAAGFAVERAAGAQDSTPDSSIAVSLSQKEDLAEALMLQQRLSIGRRRARALDPEPEVD